MPMISVAIFTLFMMPSQMMEQTELIVNSGIMTYSSLDEAAEGLAAEMNRAVEIERQPGRLIVHGFRAGNHGNLNLDHLDNTFSGAVSGSSLELYKDPYLELMRNEQGLRPMEKLSAEAMLEFAAIMDVNYVLNGEVTQLGSLSETTNNYQLELTLTDVDSGEIVWRGHADVNWSEMTAESSF